MATNTTGKRQKYLENNFADIEDIEFKIEKITELLKENKEVTIELLKENGITGVTKKLIIVTKLNLIPNKEQ